MTVYKIKCGFWQCKGNDIEKSNFCSNWVM